MADVVVQDRPLSAIETLRVYAMTCADDARVSLGPEFCKAVLAEVAALQSARDRVNAAALSLATAVAADEARRVREDRHLRLVLVVTAFFWGLLGVLT